MSVKNILVLVLILVGMGLAWWAVKKILPLLVLGGGLYIAYKVFVKRKKVDSKNDIEADRIEK